MFYEKCRKIELEDQRRDAITMAQSNVYAQPVSDKKDIRKKQDAWEKFINNLDIDYLKSRKERKKQKQTVGDVKKMVRGLGMNIPIFKPKKKQEEKGGS